MPRLSVLMPAYNSESTVEKAVRSTLRALPADAELRVMDDGSTDGTLRVLEPIAFAEKRLVVTAAPQNGGVARTLNSLLGASDSELVARMDADDVVLPWRFAVSSAVIERTRTDAVFMSVVHNDAGRLRPMAPLPLGPRGVRAALLVGNPVAHSTMMARRSALDAVSGYREVPSEDYDLWMRLSSDGYALRRTGTPGIVLRRHENQVTARPDFFAASAGDAATAHSHAELSRQVLRGAPRVFHLLHRPTATAPEAAEVAEFLRHVRAHAEGLPPLDRALVRRYVRIAEPVRHGIPVLAGGVTHDGR